MILAHSHMIPAPELSPSIIERLHDFEFVDSPVRLEQMDTFFVTHDGFEFPVFCYLSLGGICRIRRMQEKEIAYNIRGVI